MLKKILRCCALLVAFLLVFIPNSDQLFAQNSATQTAFSVSDAGAATYNIDLITAPAIGNSDLKLSLQYNSQSGNGVFGVGWSLNGVSAITRCPKTPAEEGVREGVKNTASDVFCLDGQKMRAVSGAYGTNGATYRLAKDNYSQIISNGNLGTGPTSFTVKTKAGVVMEFGVTDDSRLQHSTNLSVRVWMLNKATDRFSNAITYTYTKDLTLGEQLLRDVRYNNGLVRLIYEIRPTNDRILKYDNGIQLGSTNSRVSKIEVYDEPSVTGTRQLRLFKEYRIAYIQSIGTRRSLIASIQECAAAATTCLPAILATYRQSDPASYFHSAPGMITPLATPQAIVAADRNGVGFSSFSNLNDLFSSEILSAANGGEYRAGVWDIDGDSKADFYIALTSRYGENQNLRITNIVRYGNGAYETADGFDNKLCYADIDGDGVSELISTYGQSYALNGLLDSFYSPTPNAFALTSKKLGWDDSESLPKCKSIDVNGDGRSEILFTGISSLLIPYVAGVTAPNDANRFSTYPKARGDATFTLGPTGWEMVGTNNWSTGVFLGDFNGDGKTDRLYFDQGELTLSRKVVLSNGSFDTNLVTFALPDQYIWSPASSVVCTGDFNGDGLTDFLIGNSSVPFLSLFTFTGQGFTETVTNIPYFQNDDRGIICADFNGDGRTDVNVNSTGKIYSSTVPGPVDVLVQVNSGVGFVQKIEYKVITDTTVYTKGSGAVQPVVDLQSPVNVVARIQSGNDSQGFKSVGYVYGGLRADLRRRGTLGFATMSSYNENTGISVVTEFRQDYPFAGLKSRVRKLSSSAQLLESQTFAYEQRGYSGAAPTALYSQVNLTNSETKRFELGTSSFLGWSQETFQFDEFGNPVSSVMSQLDSAGGVTSRKSSINVYTNDISRWLIGQLSNSSVRSENLRSLPSTTTGSSPDASLQVVPPAPTLTIQRLPATMVAGQPFSVKLTSTNATTVSFNCTSSGTGFNGQGVVSDVNGTVTGTALGAWVGSANAANCVWTATGVGGTATKQETLTTVFGVLGITLPSTSISASRLTPGVLTASASVDAVGGSGVYSYSWTKVSGNRIAIANANSAAASFSANVALGENFTETVQILVTDSAGASKTNLVTLSFNTPGVLNISISPAAIVGSRDNPGTAIAYASASTYGGAAGTVTINWSKVTGSRISIGNPTLSNPSFSANLGWSENLTEVVRATFTDSAGNSTYRDANVTFTTPAALQVSINPASYASVSPCYPVTIYPAATVSGGRPPYSYNWNWQRNEYGFQPIGSYTTSSLTLDIIGGDNRGADYFGSLTITDSAGNTASNSVVYYGGACAQGAGLRSSGGVTK